jgi:hypothetical protein
LAGASCNFIYHVDVQENRKHFIIISSVGDPCFWVLQDPDPDPLVRGADLDPNPDMDPAPDPSLFS